jgi:hypothetical protein
MASSFNQVSWSHTTKRQSVRLLWMSDQLVTESSTWQYTHNRQTSMLPVGLEHTIAAGERQSTYALDRVATGTGTRNK